MKENIRGISNTGLAWLHVIREDMLPQDMIFMTEASESSQFQIPVTCNFSHNVIYQSPLICHVTNNVTWQSLLSEMEYLK